MPNLKARAVPHKQLTRATDALTEVLNEAVDTLKEAARRERSLAAGDAAEQADLRATYPSLGDGHR